MAIAAVTLLPASTALPRVRAENVTGAGAGGGVGAGAGAATGGGAGATTGAGASSFLPQAERTSAAARVKLSEPMGLSFMGDLLEVSLLQAES
ncbi:MAG: hypothetical protein EYC71_08580 [Gammaproteobacteria bacterium]|nr:MAG: hypothetical protein EYC71_08580 [Gammaproteobacteria bacterium]